MNRLIKLLFISITIICLSACNGNKLVDDSDIEGTLLDESSNAHGALNSRVASATDTNSHAIVNIKGRISDLIDHDGIKTDTRVVMCYEKEDDNVTEDEIIVDFYNGDTVIYYYIDDYQEFKEEAIQTVTCPAKNIVLKKEGSYYVKGSGLGNTIFKDITLEFGKHYVFQFGTVKSLIENYYEY